MQAKSTKAGLKQLVATARAPVGSGVRFMAQQFDAYTERGVERMKAEVMAYVQQHAGGQPMLLTDEREDDDAHE